MGSTRAEKVTYGTAPNAYTIGGATGPQILGRFGFDEDETGAGCSVDFVVQFLIQATGANPNAIYADLAQKCNAAEAMLRTARQRIEVDFGTGKQYVFEPDPAQAATPLPPTTAPTLAQSGAAGIVTAGNHFAAVTFTSAAGESVPGPPSVLVAFDGAHQATVSNIQIGPAGTTARTVYLTQTLTVLGGLELFLAVVLGDNVTTTTAVNLADVSLTTFPPTPTGVGFDAAPKLRKVGAPYDTGKARAYEWRVKVDVPPLLSGQGGRRTSNVNFHYDVNDRPVIRITGAFTQYPSSFARDQFLSQIDTYADARITLIDPSGQYTITLRDEQDNDSRAQITFVREYSQCVAGRRGSVIDIGYSPTGQRLFTFRQTYLRTAAPQAAAASSSVNFAAGGTGGIAFATAQLAALTTAQGGALTIGTDCEFTSVRPVQNEQNDRTDATITARELLFQQSGSAIGLDDPNIILDVVKFGLDPGEVDDSPAPSTGNGPVPNPNVTGPQGTGGQGASPLMAGGGGGSSSGSDSTSPVQKPVNLLFSYFAYIKKSVVNLNDFWANTILPFMLNQFATQLGVGPAEFVAVKPTVDPTQYTITATVLARGYPGGVFALDVSEAVVRDLGYRLSSAFTGVPDEYLGQQGNPKRTRRRAMIAVYTAGGSFTLAQYLTTSQVPGYVVVGRSTPELTTKVKGIPSLGIAQIALTREGLVEDMVYVARLVAGSSGPNGSSPPSGAAVAGGSGAGGSPMAQALMNSGGGITGVPEGAGSFAVPAGSTPS